MNIYSSMYHKHIAWLICHRGISRARSLLMQVLSVESAHISIQRLHNSSPTQHTRFPVPWCTIENSSERSSRSLKFAFRPGFWCWFWCRRRRRRRRPGACLPACCTGSDKVQILLIIRALPSARPLPLPRSAPAAAFTFAFSPFCASLCAQTLATSAQTFRHNCHNFCSRCPHVHPTWQSHLHTHPELATCLPVLSWLWPSIETHLEQF